MICCNNVLIISNTCDINYKERCFICTKFIYKHHHIVVCCLDSRIFHGSCLGFDRDTCYHIQNTPDWFCPSCSRDIFPLYDDFISSDTHSLPCLCRFCKSSLYNDSPQLFNPYQFDYESERELNSFDDSMSDALNIANSILTNCNYSDTDTLLDISENLSTFYFNNIDGFKTNFNEALVNINSMKTKPSLIAFCETNFKQDDIDDYEIKNYNCEHLYAKYNKKKGSGITIYYKKSHLFQRIASLDVRNNHFECISGRFKTNDSQFYIIVVYRFHNNIKTFLESFMNTISSYKDKPLLIIGDFNLDLLQFDTDPLVDEFVNNMISSSLFPLINKPTNFFRNSSTLIDHAWCNILHDDIKSYIINSSVSSHKPILTIIPTSIKQFTKDDNIGKHIRTHNINDDTISAFSKDFESILSSFDFGADFITDSSTIRSLFSNFYNKLSEIYTKNISVDKVLTSKRNCFDKPWITTGIAKACKVKNKLHNKWIRSRGSPLEDKSKKEYKLYRSRLRNIIREAELNHFRKKFSKTSDNIRKAWQVINSIRCKKKSTQFPNFIDINGSIITNRRMICNSFNDYFVNVANNFNRDKYSNNHVIPEFSEFLKDPNTSTIFLEPISNSEVEDIIAKLSNYKANDISPLLLKPLREKFSYALTYLFNSCMLAGVFPNELKLAKVIPLYKSGNRNCTSNYRPISILPTLSKIFEKLLHKRI